MFYLKKSLKIHCSSFILHLAALGQIFLLADLANQIKREKLKKHPKEPTKVAKITINSINKQL